MLTAGLGAQAKYLPTANSVENTVCLLELCYLQMIKEDNTSVFYCRPVCPRVSINALWSKIFMFMPRAADILSEPFLFCDPLRHLRPLTPSQVLVWSRKTEGACDAHRHNTIYIFRP